MVRVLTDLARREARAPTRILGAVRLRDQITRKNRTLRGWLDAIRTGPNPALVARSFLASVTPERTQAWRGALQAERPDPALAWLLDAPVRGNDGRTALETIRAWIDHGCPLPPVPPDGPVQPLALESTLDEEEHHPFGVAIGFGRIS
jgi:hypothetical protein